MPKWCKEDSPERCKKISQETGRVSREIYDMKKEYKERMGDPRTLPKIPIALVREWWNK